MAVYTVLGWNVLSLGSHVTVPVVKRSDVPLTSVAGVSPFTGMGMVILAVVMGVLSSVPLLPSVTVTAQVSVLPPSAVVTVIIAVPLAMAVTTPFETVAFAVSSDFHVTALFVALSGVTVAVRFAVPPIVRVILF